MTIYVDTRQKVGKHDAKHRQLERLGHTLVSRKIDTGDYMAEGRSDISVDTKQDLQELYGDVVSDSTRFAKEVRRAKDNGIKLYVLIEQDGFTKLGDIRNWKPSYGKLTGRNIEDRCFILHKRYGVEFVFCTKTETGQRIAEILEKG